MPTSYQTKQTVTNTFNPNDNSNDGTAQPEFFSTSTCTKDFIEIESSAESCDSLVTTSCYCSFAFSTSSGAATKEAAKAIDHNTICGKISQKKTFKKILSLSVLTIHHY